MTVLEAASAKSASTSVLLGELLVTYGTVAGFVLVVAFVLLTFVQPALPRTTDTVTKIVDRVCCCCPSDAGFAQFLNVIGLIIIIMVSASSIVDGARDYECNEFLLHLLWAWFTFFGVVFLAIELSLLRGAHFIEEQAPVLMNIGLRGFPILFFGMIFLAAAPDTVPPQLDNVLGIVNTNAAFRRTWKVQEKFLVAGTTATSTAIFAFFVALKHTFCPNFDTLKCFRGCCRRSCACFTECLKAIGLSFCVCCKPEAEAAAGGSML